MASLRMGPSLSLKDDAVGRSYLPGARNAAAMDEDTAPRVRLPPLLGVETPEHGPRPAQKAHAVH